MVWVKHYADIQWVFEDVVHKPPGGSGGVGRPVVHDAELVWAVSRTEGCLPFVPVGYADQVGAAKVSRASRG